MHLIRRRQTAVLIALCLAASVAAQEKKPKHTNRLARESSPYLLQHAHNPVNWYPWGPEAFARAKKEKKLVFLSIGYSSCHWCHVMERESFAREDVAKLMNDWFVCIKVDREERPEIDQIYMTAVQLQGGRGGWPLSMFLTADGKPVVGGTYWPREDRVIEGETVPGFKTILRSVHKAQTDEPEKIRKHADAYAERTARALIGTSRAAALIDLEQPLVAAAVDELKERFDPLHGGFGNRRREFRGTKFPTPPFLDLLLIESGRTPSAELDKMLHVTLDHMARGGICDHLGGGFHRYSTERTWTVPHFEKMLYDNAQLAEIYARAYRRSKKPLYRRVVRETLAFVERELTAPQGGFYSALDADSEEEEGRFYVWSAHQLRDALGTAADAKLFRKVYGLDGPANFEGKYFILTLPRPLDAVAKEEKCDVAELERRLAPLRKKLFDLRGKRPRPFLDKKILTAWNGQMIAGFATAGQALQEPRYLKAAARAADFILENMRSDDGRLLRSYAAQPGGKAEAKLNAYLDDYTYLVHGLLCLHDATGEKKWLAAARRLTDDMVRRFGDDAGGFYYTSKDHEKLFARAKDQYDGAQPSGNSMAARNLVRLWIKTKEERYRRLAEKTLKTFAAALKLEPLSLTTMAGALDLFLTRQSRN